MQKMYSYMFRGMLENMNIVTFRNVSQILIKLLQAARITACKTFK